MTYLTTPKKDRRAGSERAAADWDKAHCFVQLHIHRQSSTHMDTLTALFICFLHTQSLCDSSKYSTWVDASLPHLSTLSLSSALWCCAFTPARSCTWAFCSLFLQLNHLYRYWHWWMFVTSFVSDRCGCVGRHVWWVWRGLQVYAYFWREPGREELN